MPDFVLDASLTVAWCFEDEATPFTEGVYDQIRAGAESLVPAIWPSEVANALRTAERRGRITTTDADAFLAMLLTLPVTVAVSSPERTFAAIMAVARAYQLTVYDALYLDVARQEGLPLATLDQALRDAATSLGIPLVSG